jgi:integrase
MPRSRGAVASSEIPNRGFVFSEFSLGIAADFGAAWTSYRFDYSDDTWYPLDLLRPGQRLASVALRFGTLPQWLQSDAKRFIASKWLESSAAATTLVGFISALVHLGRAVPSFPGGLLDLTKRESDRLRNYFADRHGEGKLAARTARNAVVRIRRVRHFLLTLPENAKATTSFNPSVPKHLRMSNGPTFGANPDDLLTTDQVARLLQACRAEERAYEQYLAWERGVTRANGSRWSRKTLKKRGLGRTGPSGNTLRNRAMKAQIIKLAVAIGRRGSSVLAVSPSIRLEREVLGGEPILRVWPTEFKMTELPEPVVAVGYFSRVAWDAIRKARSYGARARSRSPRAAEFLFVVDDVRGLAGPITVNALNHYLNGEEGLLARRGIRRNGVIERITSHDFRTTRLTWIIEGGGSLPVAQQDAGHLNVLTTSGCYIAGTPKVVRAAEQSLSSGSASGDVWDIISGRPVGERVHPRMIERLIASPVPLVANIVRYGVCFLPAETGPCITANPCWLGPTPEPVDVEAGRGCTWLVVTKESLPELERDAELIDHEIARYRDEPAYEHWLGHLETRRRALHQVIERAKNPGRFLPVIQPVNA